MYEKSFSAWDFFLVKLEEVINEVVVGNLTGLFKSVPSLFDGCIHIVVAGNQWFQSVVCNDIGRIEINWESDVFRIVEC